MAYKLLIDGELTDSDLRLDVVNPATGQPWTSVPRASVAQAEAAVAAAKRAQPDWGLQPLDDRRKVLRSLAERIEANADAFSSFF